VKFTRWDAVGSKWVDIATDTAAPWQAVLNVAPLNGQWNQINVKAWDAAGNASASPYVFLYRTPPASFRLAVPFATQMGTAGDPATGSNNCGPASVAMAIRFFGGTTTVQAAALAIRGSNTTSNGPTDFKAATAKTYLGRFGLGERNISTYEQIRGEISAGRPVIILVNNNQYRYISPPPYSNNGNGWFTTAHIVVIAGYDAGNVFINDPLRSSGNYAVPVATFKSAASTASGTSTTSWYAVSIARA
jgi:hypothetical protein